MCPFTILLRMEIHIMALSGRLLWDFSFLKFEVLTSFGIYPGERTLTTKEDSFSMLACTLSLVSENFYPH